MMQIKIKFLLTSFILLSSMLHAAYSEEIKIPDWVRNNAKWWSNGEIDDKTFAGGIQYMIKEGIISVSVDSYQNSSDELDMSKCDQFTTAAEKRTCQKEIELAN